MLSTNEIYCQRCVDFPYAHSFELLFKAKNIETQKDVNFYYTKVSDAIRYNDTNGILLHYQNLLNMSKPDSWVWIFDCNGFGLKHSLEIKTAIGLSRIINQFGRVENILVINSNFFINAILKIVKVVLDTDISRKIILISSNKKRKYRKELSKYLYYNSDNYLKLIDFMKIL
jgi:hypothetical protein